MTLIQKLLKQECTVRIESVQLSSATPSLHLSVLVLQKVVTNSQFCLRCLLINPGHTCARVTVYLVCVCVRHHESSHYAQLSVQLKVSTASAQAGKHFKYGFFSKKSSFKSYGVIYIPGSVRLFRGVPSRQRRLQLLKSLMSG